AYMLRRWGEAVLYGSGDISDRTLWPVELRIGAIWFLLALFWAHLLLHAFAKLPYTPVWVVSSFAIGYISARYVWLPWSLQSGMCAVAFVYVGYLAKRYDLMGHVKRFPWLWGVAGVIWVVAIVRFGGMSMAINNYGTRPVQAVIGSLAGTLCVIGISKLLDHVPALGRALSWTGQSSLAILCVHLVEDDVLPWQMYLGVLHNLLPHIPLTVTSFVVRLPIDLAFAALLYYVPVVNEWFYPQLAKRRQAAA
ncbi:acyltransferase, partial [Bifidobacterium dentium]